MIEEETEGAALTNYADSCNEHFVAVFYAAEGLVLRQKNLKAALKASGRANPESIISRKRPGQGVPYSGRVKLRNAIKNCAKNGAYSDMLYKSVLVLMFAEWEEHYRERVAKQIGASKKEHVQCEFIGELRYIRNWIVHRQSRPDKNVSKMKLIPWALTIDEPFSITSDMLQDFMEVLNERLFVFNNHEESDRALL